MKKISLIKLLLFVLLLSPLVLLCACDDECSHELMSEVTVEPTHEKEGRTVYYCLDCDYEYSSNFVPPLGHTLSQELHAPTCTEQGYTYNYCNCGYHYNTDYVAPLGHTLSVETVAASCDTEGYKIADCSVCGYHYTYDVTSPLGHTLSSTRTYVSLDNEEASTTYDCSVCGLHYVGDEVFYHDIYKGAYVSNTEVLAKGLDVSYHQHEQDGDGNWLPLDWEHIKSQGYDFVILRIGYMGSGNVGVLDEVFEMNYRDAKAAGLDVGAYFFSYAYSIEDARAEAEFALSAIEGKQFEYPVFFDIEHKPETITEKGLTPTMLTDICSEFISILQSNGYFAALYTGAYWMADNLNVSKVTSLFDIWYARYDYSASSGVVVTEDTWDFEKYGDQMALWQFSETGTIDGVYYQYQKNSDGSAKPVSFDMNYVYKDYPSIMKKYGLNGYELTKDTANLDGEYSEGQTE